MGAKSSKAQRALEDQQLKELKAERIALRERRAMLAREREIETVLGTSGVSSLFSASVGGSSAVRRAAASLFGIV